MGVRALTVEPTVPASAALTDIDFPNPGPGWARVRMLAVGVCGTDIEIVSGQYGAAPPGESRLIIGHESLGVIDRVDDHGAWSVGQHVAGIVRRPDPVPCANCAAGEWDMCRNGRYTECGIKERHGFCAEYFLCETDFLIAAPPELGSLAVLIEPTSVVAKAWEHIERIGARAFWQPRRVLVTGAGPVGLLAALLGMQRGLEVHVLDRVSSGPKPDLVRALGATFHRTETAAELLKNVTPDVVLECTGAAEVVIDVMSANAHGAIVCLLGVSGAGRSLRLDVGALNRSIVLENDVIFGSVNANRRHYELAVKALCAAEPSWLSALITRRVPLARWQEALTKKPDDVKVVIVPDDAGG